MHRLQVLEKKRDGRELSDEEIRKFIQDYTVGLIPDYQAAALLMAIYIRGMTPAETLALTRAMLDSGQRVVFEGLPYTPVDKHSTGGVGDKITLSLVPLVASFGVPVPMLSGRGLGHSGGTLDKLESIPGFRVQLTLEEYQRQVERLGAVIMGQTAELAPADRKLYALRDVTATVPSVPLITASILSKKAAGGARALVLDVKVGSGAFMQTLVEARRLARSLLEVGGELGLKVSGFISRMEEPLGRFVGHALEVREALDILRDRGPEDTTELTEMLGGEMLRLAGVAASFEEGRRKIQAAIADGRGLEKLRRIIEAQGGDARVVDEPQRLPAAVEHFELKSPAEGWIQAIDARRVGLVLARLGAGRLKVEDCIDPRVGLEMRHKVGARVTPGEVLAVVHLGEWREPSEVETLLRDAYRIGPAPPAVEPVVVERISP